MDFLRTLLARCAALLRRRRLDADLEEELRAHLDLAIAENLKAGLSPEEARLAALRAFGGVSQAKESYREQRGFPLFSQLWRDLIFASRQLRKSPGFALTAILTLALGIGAVTSVFSIVSAVLLKPFSFRDPAQLISVRETEDEIKSQEEAIPVNYRHYVRLKHDSKTLEDAALFQQMGESVSLTGERPQVVGALAASPNFFHVLGIAPMLGRDFVAADAVKGAPPVVILSYNGWKELAGGDPNAVGRTLRVGGDPATVVGVLPADFHFPHVAIAPHLAGGPVRETLVFDAYIPTDWDLSADTANFNFNVIARVKPGISVAQAGTELETLQRSYTASAHLPVHFGISVTPLSRDITSGISGALWLIFGAVGAVLLIACVNLANLQLSRVVASERETAVRAALGASKTSLILNRFAESLLLSLAGGLAGAALAFWGTRFLLALAPANIPRLSDVRVSLPVLLFSAGLSIAAAVVFGTLPAMRSLRVEPQKALQASSVRTVNSREGTRTRSLLVATQVAVTIVLLVLTSLMLRSFSHLMRQNLGFDASHTTLVSVDLFAPSYGDKVPGMKAAKLAFVDRTLAAMQGLPGVQSVGVTSAAPLTGQTWVDDLTRPDHPVPQSQRPMINIRWTNPDYFSTMRIPLVAGRWFTSADRANPNVALISEGLARVGFPGEDPIGKKMSELVPESQDNVTIIGVVADTRINGLKETASMVYIPYWAFTPWTLSFLVRGSQPSSAMISEMRRAVWSIDPQVAIPSLKSMDNQMSESVATDRFQTVVLTSFGAAALLLALLGVYGVLAYAVSLRRQEFGIRIALGSGKTALMRLVVLQAAYPVLMGAGAGLVVALVFARWVRSLLYQAPAFDPLAVGGSLLLIVAASVIAAALPARRAASVDPMQALRIE